MSPTPVNTERPRSQGKFIVIEGGDSAGKHTQAKLLFDHLKRSGRVVELLSFPQYDTRFGQLVANYLRGEYGTLESIPPEIPSLLYALDRYQAKDRLAAGLQAGRWFIADRYTQSNLAHQGAKLTGSEREKFIQWVEDMESRLPQPELTIYLHMPVNISQELMTNREHKSYLDNETDQDIHEQDTDYQQRVIDAYLALAAARNDWAVVHCVDNKTGKLHSIENIHREIVKIVNERFDL